MRRWAGWLRAALLAALLAGGCDARPAQPPALHTAMTEVMPTMTQQLALTLPEPGAPAQAPQPLATPDFLPLQARLDALLPPARQAQLDALLPGATIAQLEQAQAQGRASAEETAAWYLDRIQHCSLNGLNAVIAVNPTALADAARLDDERRAGKLRGPLHGIPLLIKDNIATADPMPTTAGAYVLRTWQADRDAFLVQRLRAAGAVILGKANLSEWANWMDDSMPDGFSVVGGQTANPYGPFSPSGSSSGSAVGVAADLAAGAVGTETTGSIIAPAEANSVVGLKPSLGLVSRHMVVPLIGWLDTPGPLARTVSDVAVLLNGMAGVDPADPATAQAAALAGFDFTQALSLDAARKLRVGMVTLDEAAIQAHLAQVKAMQPNLGDGQVQAIRAQAAEFNRRVQAAGEVLARQGIAVVPVAASELPPPTPTEAIITQGFRAEIDAFLAGLGGAAPVASLAEVVAANAEEPAVRAPYGQGLLQASLDSPVSAEEYRALSAQAQQGAASGLRRILAEHKVDVLLVNFEVTQSYAAAGFPALSVPAGYAASGHPFGMVFTGDYLSEPKLLAVGYAFEQATQARIAPGVEKRVQELRQGK